MGKPRPSEGRWPAATQQVSGKHPCWENSVWGLCPSNLDHKNIWTLGSKIITWWTCILFRKVAWCVKKTVKLEEYRPLFASSFWKTWSLFPPLKNRDNQESKMIEANSPNRLRVSLTGSSNLKTLNGEYHEWDPPQKKEKKTKTLINCTELCP